MRFTTSHLAAGLCGLALVVAPAGAALAREAAVVERVDASTAELKRETRTPVSVWISADTVLDEGDTLVARASTKQSLALAMPAGARRYALLEGADGAVTVTAERLLPLEQGSNFRDIGGYATRDGRTVRWGRAFRSGAMPLLSESDYALIGSLGLDSVVDLRSLEEREIAADAVDDRTGALFLSNDYSMKVLFEGLRGGQGENMYKGMEQLLVPQYRALYRRIMAGEGAVLYHCSAGQDRTGIATALLYDLLGVDRETILKDYHLSTGWRQPKWEMPEVDPADHPGNVMVQIYATRGKGERAAPAPLYTPGGQSHLAQFFVYLDAKYGGSEGYMKQALAFSDADIARLRESMLE